MLVTVNFKQAKKRPAITKYTESFLFDLFAQPRFELFSQGGFVYIWQLRTSTVRQYDSLTHEQEQ